MLRNRSSQWYHNKDDGFVVIVVEVCSLNLAVLESVMPLKLVSGLCRLVELEVPSGCQCFPRLFGVEVRGSTSKLLLLLARLLLQDDDDVQYQTLFLFLIICKFGYESSLPCHETTIQLLVTYLVAA